MSNTEKKSPSPNPANPGRHQPTKAELEEEIDMPEHVDGAGTGGVSTPR